MWLHAQELDLGYCSSVTLGGLSTVAQLTRLTRLELHGLRTDEELMLEHTDPHLSHIVALTGAFILPCLSCTTLAWSLDCCRRLECVEGEHTRPSV